MIGLKTLVARGLLFLLVVFLTEQAIIPGLVPEIYPSIYPSVPLSQYRQADHFSDFFIQPVNYQQTLPAPVIKEPLFKWKPFMSERFFQPYKSIGGYPELVQDVLQCTCVSIVLFPYHEFL